MWTAFGHLIWRAVLDTIREKGTTLLTVGLGLLVSLFQLGVNAWSSRKSGNVRRGLTTKLRDWKSYIGVAIGAVAWSCVFIYTAAGIVYDEHGSMRATIAGLKKPQTDGPSFRPAIVDVGIFPAGDATNSAVMVVGTIYNDGAPGSLSNIVIDVVLKDGRRVSARLANPFDPRQAVNLGKNAQGKLMQLPGSMYWLNERSVVIPRYGRLDGFAAGLFLNVSLKDFKPKQTTFILSCADIAGKKSSARYVWGSGTPESESLGIGDLQRPLRKK
jgi:hypothetical protein